MCLSVARLRKRFGFSVSDPTAEKTANPPTAISAEAVSKPSPPLTEALPVCRYHRARPELGIRIRPGFMRSYYGTRKHKSRGSEKESADGRFQRPNRRDSGRPRPVDGDGAATAHRRKSLYHSGK